MRSVKSDMDARLEPAFQTWAEAAPASLAELIGARGLLAAPALARARRVEAETGERLASVLTRLGFISEQALAQSISEASGLPLAHSKDYPQTPVDDGRISPRFLRDAKAVPLSMGATRAEVAFVDPFDTYSIRALTMALGLTVQPLVGSAGDVELALDRIYGAPATAAAEVDIADEADLDRLKDLASDAPAIRAVNRLISLAVELRASDIHLEPTESELHIRLRIDGVMQERDPLPASMRSAAVSRIKVMAGLNIAERRLPQDGRLKLAVRGHDIDLRVATSPTIYGEGVVLRLLDRSHLTLDFEALGFDALVLARLRPVLTQPNGIVLVTGPTGSGKTTTLYAALSEINAPERKLLTIEDPIEYRLAGVNQTQVAPTIGLSFAAALRSFLRQDPDVMMVGEIRDIETAQVATQAALTGHMILSTLHTNSAATAITRLLDMGVEPFLITSTLNAVLGQRLVRRLCPECREPYTVNGLDLGSRDIGRAIRTLYRATGCDACGGSGFRGRIAILELLLMNEAISKRVIARAEAAEIEAAAIANGMRPMLHDGVAKAAAGMTTIEEVLRVTREI